MTVLSVFAAAVASWVFGAIWYSVMAKPWLSAVGLTEETINRKNPVPYIGSFLAVLVAGMMRHVFFTSGIDSVGKGFITGLGIGLFLATPWLATNYLFAQRPKALILIDGAYATGGCAVMGLVLMLI